MATTRGYGIVSSTRQEWHSKTNKSKKEDRMGMTKEMFRIKLELQEELGKEFWMECCREDFETFEALIGDEMITRFGRKMEEKRNKKRGFRPSFM